MTSSSDTDRNTHSTAPSRRPRDRRQQIHHNARDLFAQRGFHSVRMSDIAEITGITSRALYRHYDNKQALLADVLEAEQAAFLAAAPDLGPAYDPTKLDDDLVVFIGVALEDRHLSRLWQREARHLAPTATIELRRRLRRMVLALAEVVERRCPTLDPIHAEIRAWTAISIIFGHEQADNTVDTDRLAELLRQTVLAVIDDERRDVGGIAPPALVPATPSGDRRRPVSRREQLLTAAASHFRNHGFVGASVDSVAADGGLVGPGIYRYFDNKVDMLAALISRFHEWVAIETKRALLAARDDHDVAAALVTAYVRIALEATDLLAVTVTERHHLPDAIGERFERMRNDHVAEWARWIAIDRPALAESEALLLARVSRTLIDDAVRTPSLARRPELPAALTTAALTVMFGTELDIHDGQGEP